ncbi:DUF1508 domain-containing protein [Amycolatopsis sp. H20-H5]|uniref:DUF1508 domain-containing protein n=1 Tax=Amycolatopsis sp. H20-H5 TaxID=3046309 RepID=UPI002DB7F2C1|nr:DUF1508 domain-containing protein [Amycolatopsis sp. H20-H5]MEC3979221.1 DUF1508 domain-containing protein [Amycolatopsis sp. H20-H5]
MKKNPRFQLVRTGTDTVRWRLLGGNNVSLGSGACEYARTEDCLAAIDWVGHHHTELTGEFSHSSGGRWRWRLRSDTELIAVASHAYGRRIEAQRSLERFHAGVAEAISGQEIDTIADWRTKYARHSQDNSEYGSD